MKNANYEKLNQKGYLEEETVITDGDVIIAKLILFNQLETITKYTKIIVKFLNLM